MTSNDRRQHPQVLSAAHLILILIPILEQLRLFGPSFAPPSSVNIIVKQHTNDHTSSSDNSDRPTDRRRERRHRPRRRSPYLSRPIMIEPLPSEQINIRKYTNPDRVRIHPAKVTGHWSVGLPRQLGSFRIRTKRERIDSSIRGYHPRARAACVAHLLCQMLREYIFLILSPGQDQKAEWHTN